MRGTPLQHLALGASMLLVVACNDLSPTDPAASPADPDAFQVAAAEMAGVVVPSPLVSVAANGDELEFWPYTGTDLNGTASDPINLIFPNTDIRSVRTALMMVDGDRSSFGPLAAFDCVWKDAMGANQTGYASAVGWQGSAAQLECGDYGPVRFHVRLFQLGDWTVGGAHFEVQIPGTNEHEVLSWELPEALVAADIVRAGVLGGAPSASDPITPVPTYRAINPLVYNGLPAALKAIAGGPSGSTPTPVPLANDGRATILPFAGPVEGGRMVTRREFVLEFDQTIPKPFCMEGPTDYLQVQGPIRFTQQIVESGNGNLHSNFQARGRLSLTPIDVGTGEVGEPMEAKVQEHHRSVVTDRVTLVSSLQLQMILPANKAGGGRLRATLQVGPGASDHGSLSVSCGS